MNIYDVSGQRILPNGVYKIGDATPVNEWENGSLNSSGQYVSAQNRIVSGYILLGDNDIKITANGQKIAYCLYNDSKTFLLNSGWVEADVNLHRVQTATYARFVVANSDDSAISPANLEAEILLTTGQTAEFVDAKAPIQGFVATPFTQTVEVVMHRGYNLLAPENTIPAFKLARQMGFSAIETDVQLTYDGVPVILHDSTVNRTSNGTGVIYNMTLTQVKALDFGEWKSSMWSGTKIPTFEEMLLCCKKIGLDVYIEVKSESPWTQEAITNCVNLVRGCGMQDHVTWISFSDTILNYVKTAESSARLGFLMTTYTTAAVDTCLSLRTASNVVLAVTRYDLLTTSVLNYMIEKKVPLVAYLFDSESDAEAMQPYVTAALTNRFNVSEYIYGTDILI